MLKFSRGKLHNQAPRQGVRRRRQAKKRDEGVDLPAIYNPLLGIRSLSVTS